MIGPGPAGMVHPQAIVVATGAFEQNVVFAGNEVPGVFLDAGPHACRSQRHQGRRERGDPRRHHEAPPTPPRCARRARTSRPSCCPRMPTTPASRVRASCAAACRRRPDARTSALSRWRSRPAARSSSPRDGARALRRLHAPRRTAAPDLRRTRLGRRRHRLPGPLEQVIADAAKVGAAAAGGQRIELPALGAKTQACGSDGYVCICYDVTVGEVERSVKEGFRSTELLKRYTTATMGACQGRLCHGQLRELQRALLAGWRSDHHGWTRRDPRRARSASRRPSRATGTTSSGAPACTTPTSRSARASCGRASGSASSTTASRASPT